MRSVSKTVTSVALGIGEAEGRLALDDHDLKYYRELACSAAPGLDQVSLRHLLMMTSGSPYFWSAYDPVVVPDLADDFFATPLAHETGTYFSYTAFFPYVAMSALLAASGANVRDYLLPVLFTPLAIHNPQWHTCPLGHPVTESALFLRTSELARFGRLLLDEGRHEAASWSPSILRTHRDRNRPDHAGPNRRRLPTLGQLRPRRLVHPRGKDVQNGGPLRPALHNLPG